MGREWAPGDVAMVTTLGGTLPALRLDGKWACSYGAGHYHEDADVTDARPLVVIDADDDERVERFARGYIAAADAATSPYGVGDVDLSAVTSAMQAALRSLIEPPKPPEPLGLGAVVEDDKGERWVADYIHDDGAVRWYGPRISRAQGVHEHRPWSNITATKVLSKGVS